MKQQLGEQTIRGFLTMATKALQDVNIASARLDSEIILQHVLGLPRTWLLAHDEASIADDQWQQLCRLLYLRCQHCPIAYLTGRREFYGRDFYVNSQVLIPRPETEQIIELLGQLCHQQPDIRTVIDVGTGSGCLAITALLEHPELTVYACDISRQALEVAQRNARRLFDTTSQQQSLHFIQSDLLSSIPAALRADVIMANLPYVDHDWPDLSPELAYEPAIALYDDQPESLGLIKQLIIQAQDHLTDHGYLILEMDRRQTKSAIQFATNHGYEVVVAHPFTIVLRLVQATEDK